MPQLESKISDYLMTSATEVARRLAAREISSRELTQDLLARIDDNNPALNAVVELRREEALADADAADRALARGTVERLLGVPITIKEAFNVAGMKTTWGNPAFSEYRAAADATVVRRLKQAGAVILGKTNTHFMLADFAQTFNDVYGVTVNPWDAALTPGGSSGGSAAAAAAGLTFLEFGSDLVGSIRIPAAFCGVYGLRPSVGIVPQCGFQVPYAAEQPSEMRYMSAIGPITRSAADLRSALLATAGPENPCARGYGWTLAPPRHEHLSEYRVGVVLDHSRAPVSSDLTSSLATLVEAIAGSGAEIVEGWPDDVDPVQEYETFGYHVQLFLAYHDPDAEFHRLPELLVQERRRMAARAAWTRFFADVDVFICPANFTVAFPHDRRPFDQRTIMTPDGARRYDDQPFWTAHATIAGLPAAVAPIGSDPTGVPVAVQIIAPPYEDDTAIAFAELLAQEVGGYEPPRPTPPQGS
jgi:amidase